MTFINQFPTLVILKQLPSTVILKGPCEQTVMSETMKPGIEFLHQEKQV